MKRRKFLKVTGSTIGAIGLATPGIASFSALNRSKIKGVGMCDWNVGITAKADALTKARSVNLNAVQVSVGTDPKNIPLRDPAIRAKFKQISKESGVAVCSVAAGSILNKLPLASEPQSAVYVIDAIEAAQDLGAKNILIAFFGNGDLRRKDLYGNLLDLKDGSFSSYELDSKMVQRVVEALRQIAPRAEDAGVALGLENTLTAQQNLDIIDRVGSDMVKVYYDVGNSWGNGYDVPKELRLLGNEQICEVHLKDWNTPMLGTNGPMVDMKACANALDEIGYDKWVVLETSGRKDQFEDDTKTNVAFVRKTFHI